MWMEVFISGVGNEIELKPVGKTYRWDGKAYKVVDEAPRKIATPDGSLKLNFVDTSGPEDLPVAQTIYYGKYAITELSTGKTVYIDFSDADYPYGSGVINIVGKWEDFEADATYAIWNWRGNAKSPNQEYFK